MLLWNKQYSMGNNCNENNATLFYYAFSHLCWWIWIFADLVLWFFILFIIAFGTCTKLCGYVCLAKALTVLLVVFPRAMFLFLLLFENLTLFATNSGFLACIFLWFWWLIWLLFFCTHRRFHCGWPGSASAIFLQRFS